MVKAIPESERQPYLDTLSKNMWNRVTASSDNSLMSAISRDVLALQRHINDRLTGQQHRLGVGINPDTQALTVGAFTDDGFVPYNKLAVFRELKHEINADELNRNLDNLSKTAALSALVINKADKTTTITDVKNHIVGQFNTDLDIEGGSTMAGRLVKQLDNTAGGTGAATANPNLRMQGKNTAPRETSAPTTTPKVYNPVEGKIRGPETTNDSDKATLGTFSPNRDEAGQPIRPVVYQSLKSFLSTKETN